MRVALPRWVCLDVETNLRRLPGVAAAAAERGAELVVFPELFVHGYSQPADPDELRTAFAAVSARHRDTTFVFGSHSEEEFNRSTLWRAGREVARYDKVHLFLPNREETRWHPGDRYVAVRLPRVTAGLLTCNDVRFPEQARALRLEARCELLVVVAWWPWRRHEVWEALLRARAIENGVFVLGCCIAGSEVPAERFAGAGNCVFDPLGEPVRTADDLTYDLELTRAAEVLVDPLRTYCRIDQVEVVDAAG